jgi:hypothetical protein
LPTHITTLFHKNKHFFPINGKKFMNISCFDPSGGNFDLNYSLHNLCFPVPSPGQEFHRAHGKKKSSSNPKAAA